MNEKKNNIEGNNQTRDLFIKVLEKLGCQYTVDEEDAEYAIKFDFSDETLYANVVNGCYDIDVWFPYWFDVDWDNDDAYAGLTNIVNEMNMIGKTKFFYTTHGDENKVWVHNRLSFLLLPSIPEIEDYVSEMLNLLMIDQKDFLHEIKRLKIQVAKSRLLSTMERNDSQDYTLSVEEESFN